MKEGMKKERKDNWRWKGVFKRLREKKGKIKREGDETIERGIDRGKENKRIRETRKHEDQSKGTNQILTLDTNKDSETIRKTNSIISNHKENGM